MWDVRNLTVYLVDDCLDYSFIFIRDVEKLIYNNNFIKLFIIFRKDQQNKEPVQIKTLKETQKIKVMHSSRRSAGRSLVL